MFLSFCWAYFDDTVVLILHKYSVIKTLIIEGVITFSKYIINQVYTTVVGIAYLNITFNMYRHFNNAL